MDKSGGLNTSFTLWTIIIIAHATFSFHQNNTQCITLNFLVALENVQDNVCSGYCNPMKWGPK